MTLPATLTALAALEAAATKGNWRVRQHPQIEEEFFVEAPRQEGRPYGTEILGDENYPTKRGDAAYIVALHESAPLLIAELRRLERVETAAREYRGMQMIYNLLGDADSPADGERIVAKLTAKGLALDAALAAEGGEK